MAGSTAEPGRRRRNPEERRREILDAAAEIIIEQGPAALTHRAVVARAGIPLGTMTRHFPSIDELREASLQQLGDVLDAELDSVERVLSACDDPAEHLAALWHDFLLDSRTVHSSMALFTAATSDDRLRSLARGWTDRLTDILAVHVGEERALATEAYLDGTVIHASLHDTPLSRETLHHTIRGLFRLPDQGQPS